MPILRFLIMVFHRVYKDTIHTQAMVMNFLKREKAVKKNIDKMKWNNVLLLQHWCCGVNQNKIIHRIISIV